MTDELAAQQVRATYPQWVSDPDDYDNCREIAPGLFVGSSYSPRLPIAWHVVIDLCGSSRSGSYERSRPDIRAGYRRARQVIILPFEDGDPVPVETLDTAWKAYKAANGPVLVHCAAGYSRSASVGYALLRRRFKSLTHADAHAIVRVKDPYPLQPTLQSARAWVHARRGSRG